MCMRQVFKAALADYNDYDTGNIRIKVNPWMRVKIPAAERPEKLAITPEKGSRQQSNDEPGLFRFSRKHLVRGEVWYKGERHGEVEDVGFGNVDDVIRRLVPFVPEDVPQRAMVLRVRPPGVEGWRCSGPLLCRWVWVFSWEMIND